ncbi:MAG: hypothetical protein JEZ04_12025 [Spirochaetales bacterium]|nr:hypothetical protein [Spirochaetales bacterium]
MGAIGIGTYFLAVSLPLLSTYTTAQRSYTEASAEADFTSLYNAAEAARIAALDGNANQNFIIGAALSGAGLGLGILSTILFLSEDNESQPTVNISAAVLPCPGATSLSFRLSY